MWLSFASAQRLRSPVPVSTCRGNGSEHRCRNSLKNVLQHQIHLIRQTTSNRVCHARSHNNRGRVMQTIRPQPHPARLRPHRGNRRHMTHSRAPAGRVPLRIRTTAIKRCMLSAMVQLTFLDAKLSDALVKTASSSAPAAMAASALSIGHEDRPNQPVAPGSLPHHRVMVRHLRHPLR